MTKQAEYEWLAERIISIMRETVEKLDISKQTHDIYLLAATHAADIVRKSAEGMNNE